MARPPTPLGGPSPTQQAHPPQPPTAAAGTKDDRSPRVPNVLREIHAAAQQIESAVTATIERLGQQIETAVTSTLERVEKEMWEQIEEMEAERDLATKRLDKIEKHLRDDSAEELCYRTDTYARLHAFDERQTLRHDLAYSTFFRHVEGNEGVFERWSARLSRIEAALSLPVGSFEDYRPISTVEYPADAVRQAASRVLDDDEVDARMISALAEDRKKGKARAEMPIIPGSGPSVFAGSYVAEPPVFDPHVYAGGTLASRAQDFEVASRPPNFDEDSDMDESDAPSSPAKHADALPAAGTPAAAEHPTAEGHIESDEVEFVGDMVPSPRKLPSSASHERRSSDEVQFVEQPTRDGQDADVDMADVTAVPAVNIIPPTPFNSQPQGEGDIAAPAPLPPATDEPAVSGNIPEPVTLPPASGEPAAPPALDDLIDKDASIEMDMTVPASREAARLLITGWGADISQLPLGPPAARTRGRSRANSIQPPALEHSADGPRPRLVATAEPSSNARKSRSPKPRTPLA